MTVAERELTVFGKESLFREPIETQSLCRAALFARILRIGPRALLGFGHAGKEHVKEGSIRIDAHFLGFAEHVRQCLLAAGDLLFAPTLGDLEAFGEFEHGGHVAHGFAHRFDHLSPTLRAAFGVAVQTPLFEDHGGGKNQVGNLGRKGRVDVGDDDEVLGLASSLEPMVGVRSRLEDIDHLCPQEVHGTVFETAQQSHDGLTKHGVERTFGNAPEFFGLLVVSRVADEHVGRQTVREGADFTSRTASRGLTGEREGTVTGTALFGGEQMQCVNLFVYPHTAHVLIDAHAPEGENVALGVAINVSQSNELLFEAFERFVRITLGKFGDEVKRIGFQTALVFFKRNVPVAAGGGNLLLFDFNAGLAALADGFSFGQDDLLLLGLNVLFCFKGELIGRSHTVADVDRAGGEDAVIVNELLVVSLAANDFSSQVVEDREVRIGLENDFDIGHARGHVRVRRHVDDTGVLVRELSVGHTAPENRMRFGHVVAPKHHCVALFDVVIDVHRFVHAEGLVEAHHGGSHAQTGVGVDIVGAEAGFEHLRSRVGFGNRVLA